jgi:hypothetical protein
MAKKYEPPKQGIGLQIVDVIVLAVLVGLVLFLPLYTGWAGAGRTEKLPDGVSYTADAEGAKTWTVTNADGTTGPLTWEKLGQNATMAAQWEKLGYTPESAADIVTMPFDYSIDWAGLIGTIVIILGYFAFLLWHSEKEYRQVISEKFD